MKATPYKFSVTALVFTTLIGLSGCGQSGPLYLPEQQAKKQNQPKPAQPKAPEAKNQER
ncbi:LPS translocon maturation chaperone LptM [Pseudoalteromonas piscicida]|uniref:LPS translocon maturation chaperone LptM n=1 Tax=Pseudoalteromonas piscicida TaxID=43662 RepID=UPI0030AC358D